jgi:hypothetical protein
MQADQPTRRKLLATIASAAAMAPIAALPALAAAGEPDPIFAAIAAHREAHADLVAACDQEDRLDEILPEDKRQSVIAAWGETIVASDASEWLAFLRSREATSEAEWEAAGVLVDIAPTTLAGVRALLTYACEHIDNRHIWPEYMVDGRNRDWSYLLHKSLADALARIAS